MMLLFLANLLHSLILILLFTLLLGRNKNTVLMFKSILVAIIIAGLQFGVKNYASYWLNRTLPILIMSILFIFGNVDRCKPMFRETIKAVMTSYIVVVFIDILLGFVCGIYVTISGQKVSILSKYIVVCLLRSIVLLLFWKKYDWLQIQIKKLATHIMIFGAFLLLFQQLFLMAFSEKKFNVIDILLLLVYITMIYTALMNLQHRHLTADNQRILDDNQRMSQEIHRSRDVIDVVSRVVATEDTIDPKLRQELADFCKSEKQEMFDPDLAASLIGDTGMDLLNALLRDKLCQCRQQEISFEVMIPEMIDTYVSDIGIGEAELLRVINDLVKNAVTAINKTDGEVREILLILAVGPSDCLELCVYDSGVPFPDFILERFGERGNTTTGTGNGLADTVNTLRTYDASIEIEAIDPGTDIYTKCVRICFDGKNEIHI